MRTWIVSVALLMIVVACSSSQTASIASNTNLKDTAKLPTKGDTVRIANDSLEYEIIITDPGFNQFLNGTARPRNYYGLAYLERRNLFYVMEWNRRVLDPFRYDPNLYMLRIDYDSSIRYGYEVNYLLYNYFLFFQREYRQQL